MLFTVRMEDDDERERRKYDRGASANGEIGDANGFTSPSTAGDIGSGGRLEMNSSSPSIFSERGGGRSTSASKSYVVL